MILGSNFQLQHWSGHSDWVRAVAFSSDGSLVTSASYDGTARLWCALTGECLQTLMSHDKATRAASETSD